MLRLVRERRGISLRDLAEALGMGRTGSSHLSRLERGEVQASLELANRIAHYFRNEITRDQILFPEDYPMHKAAEGAPPLLAELEAK